MKGWETKVVDLSDLQAVDLFINFWGSTLICHPIVSFQFGPTEHVAISVETRMAEGQSYSTIRGFFKQFSLIYIVADERDVVRVRTNYRTNNSTFTGPALGRSEPGLYFLITYRSPLLLALGITDH